MPSSPATKVLLGVAGLVFVTGAAVAVIQPGDLGDDDDTETADGGPTTTTAAAGADPTAAESTVTVTTPTTATAAGVTQTTTAAGATTSTPPGATPTTAATVTTAPTPTTAATVTTVGPGSGLGEDDISRADVSTAATGIESMLGPGLGLAWAAGVLRAVARRRRTV